PTRSHLRAPSPPHFNAAPPPLRPPPPPTAPPDAAPGPAHPPAPRPAARSPAPARSAPASRTARPASRSRRENLPDRSLPRYRQLLATPLTRVVHDPPLLHPAVRQIWKRYSRSEVCTVDPPTSLPSRCIVVRMTATAGIPVKFTPEKMATPTVALPPDATSRPLVGVIV